MTNIMTERIIKKKNNAGNPIKISFELIRKEVIKEDA
jgi:hypothetical protein